MMLKAGYVPPPAWMDKKTAQFFVCVAYLGYRKSRELYYRLKNFQPNDKLPITEQYLVMLENWNNLQLIKGYYYDIPRN